METNSIDSMLAELAQERPDVLAIIEGLGHDLEQKDLLPVTGQEVQRLLAEYQRRNGIMVRLQGQLNQARETVLELLQDGYPNLPEIIIDALVFDDLEQNLATIERAQAQFKPRALTTSGASTVGPEEPLQRGA